MLLYSCFPFVTKTCVSTLFFCRSLWSIQSNMLQVSFNTHRDAGALKPQPLHPAELPGLWERQQSTALLRSACNCKPKQHWQQQATIFNYTIGIICSLKNSLIALCLTIPSLSHTNQVLSISQQPWGPWNMSTSFLESFVVCSFFPQHNV